MRAPRSTPAVSVSRIVASMAVFVLMAGCGYKGDLYMPPPADPALVQPPAAPASIGEGAAISR